MLLGGPLRRTEDSSFSQSRVDRQQTDSAVRQSVSLLVCQSVNQCVSVHKWTTGRLQPAPADRGLAKESYF